MDADAPSQLVGRITIDSAGIIRAADAAFGQAMRADASLVGTCALSLTAPADRDRCRTLVARLCQDGGAVATVKRMIRSDGTHIWLRNCLTLLPDTAEPLIAIDLFDSAAPAGWVEPDRLLRMARLVFSSRRGRADSFGTNLFSDHAWDMLLAAYICESEGSVATIARIHAWTAIPLATASRWIRALSGEGLIEYEDDGNHQLVTTPFRLTSSAHGKFEQYLSDVYRNRADFARLALGPSEF